MRRLEIPWIRLAQVSKVFQQGAQTIRAVDHISLDVAPGEFLAITGASGSGKSTLLHLIAGLETPTSGTVSIGETALETMDDTQLSTLRLRTIGFVFQFFNLLPGTDGAGKHGAASTPGRTSSTAGCRTGGAAPHLGAPGAAPAVAPQ